MERIPIEERTGLHDLVAGVYNIVFEDDLHPAEIDLYYIDSEHVEAEIELPYIGLNRAAWEERWTPERKLEVLLHELAHVEEGPDEPDHGPQFYRRLAELARIIAAHRSEIESLFDAPIDFDLVYEHVVDSVNEYTVERDIDSVEQRQRVLREELPIADPAQ